MASPLVDYRVKVPLCVDVIVDGCHSCTVEGYALSESDSGDLMNVALIAEPIRRADQSIDHTYDDVGDVILEHGENGIVRQFLAYVLWREARKPETLEELESEYAARCGNRRAEAKAEAFLAVRRGV